MTMLILGLVLFLSVHSVRIVADDWRSSVRARIGENGWKGLFSVLSLLGFVLICYGYGLARQQPVVLWATPPMWTRHLAALLTVPAFVLLAASQVPGNIIKAKLRHPMLLGVKLWATAHLIANNTAADLLLFGTFLVWAAIDFRSARQRDRVQQIVYPAGRSGPTVVAVVVGLAAWAGFAFWAHAAWIGVRPFG